YPQEDIIYTLAEVHEKETKEVLLEEAEGCVCADYVNLYPPGIPLFLPGERITKEHIALIDRYLEKGMHVQGVNGRLIHVCK
ncbi:MAG: ornithine decarboxylase, partial [Lachnospiraceae bacterium]|nr:ornithine decarboxylase [Lachnospiraceae bacterium]